MRQAKGSADIEIYDTIEVGEEEVDVVVKASVTPLVPARTYGPPEKCYPAEGGEVEDTRIFLAGGAAALRVDKSWLEWSPEQRWDALPKDEQRRLEDLLRDRAAEAEQVRDAEDADYQIDARRDGW